MGFDLMRNFRQPYFATSVSDFWRRWHISLSTWFRDYVYVPLGGNRVSPSRWRVNIAVVFGLSGLWHGASWTFVAWGAIHAVLMVVESLTGGVRSRLADGLGLSRLPVLLRLVSTTATFALVLVAWTFFRAETIDDALVVIARMADFEGFRLASLWSLGLPRFELLISAVAVAVLFLVDGLIEFSPGWLHDLWERRPIRWACLLAGTYAIVFFGVFGEVEFIYFQF
jgi:D-alanyl-lipoteichoic acid acyltransferase DltB (MBOAT superfamily)